MPSIDKPDTSQEHRYRAHRIGQALMVTPDATPPSMLGSLRMLLRIRDSP
jgi:hypothetical protein